jgi:hypothetical protein
MSSQEPAPASSSSRQESTASENKSKEDKKWSARNAFSVVSRREFYLLWLTRFGMVLLSQGISGYYKAYALKELGYRDNFLASVGATAGIFNCFGRLLFGFLVDRISYRLVRASVQHHQVFMHRRRDLSFEWKRWLFSVTLRQVIRSQALQLILQNGLKKL